MTTYFDGDLRYFIALGPVQRLWTPKSAERTLKFPLAELDELGHELPKYPTVSIERLEFFYACWRGVCAMDPDFLEDLLTHFGWRGLVWGGWLARMNPRDDLAPALRAALAAPLQGGRREDNLWAAKCALAAIDGSAPPPALAGVDGMAERCHRAIRSMPRIKMPLRRSASPEELERWRSAVGEAYRAGGVETAQTSISAIQKLRDYTLPYAAWYRTQPEPDVIPMDDVRTALGRRIQEAAQRPEQIGDPMGRFARKGLLLIHANAAFFWMMAPDGAVYCVDQDDFSQRPELETEPRAIREAIEAGVRAVPELTSLLEGVTLDAEGSDE